MLLIILKKRKNGEDRYLGSGQACANNYISIVNND